MKYGYYYYDQKSNSGFLKPGFEEISDRPIHVGVKSYRFEGYPSSIVRHLLKNKDTEIIAQGIGIDGHWKDGAQGAAINILVNKTIKTAFREMIGLVRKGPLGGGLLPTSLGVVADLCSIFGSADIIPSVKSDTLSGRLKNILMNEKVRLELNNYAPPNIHGEYGPDISVNTGLVVMTYGKLADVLINGKL